jgi:hypothetical protein
MKNSSGNLVLHLIGGLNHFIGATLAHTGYIRDRDQEFAKKGAERKVMVAKLFDSKKSSTGYVLVQLLSHLNYHLGQINYLRRALE